MINDLLKCILYLKVQYFMNKQYIHVTKLGRLYPWTLSVDISFSFELPLLKYFITVTGKWLRQRLETGKLGRKIKLALT